MDKDTFKVDDLGIMLSDKSAKLICARRKKDIILVSGSNVHTGKSIFLCGKQVYGIIELNQPLILDDYLFNNKYKRHLISEEEKETYWPNEKRFYSYSFRIKRIFKEPLDFIKDSDDIGFMNSVNFSLEVAGTKTQRNINFSKFYDEIIELEKLAAIEGYEGIKNTLLELYKLLVKRSEIRYKSLEIDHQINCQFCERDFNFKREQWHEGMKNMYIKCPYCLKEGYYEKIKSYLKSLEMVKCSHCESDFNYNEQTEAGIGYISCPICNAVINQEGK